MTESEIIDRLQKDNARLLDDAIKAGAQLINNRAKLESLAKRSGELERSANLVACQAAELCRQLRGGNMEHLNTKP